MNFKKTFALIFCFWLMTLSIALAAQYETNQIKVHVNRQDLISDNSGAFKVEDEDAFIFPNTVGPSYETQLPQLLAAKWEDYHNPGGEKMAVLLTEENSAWLTLAYGLKSIGIPFTITNDWKEALQQPVVMVYPSISGKNLSQEALKALAAFPRNGGTLIGSAVLGGGLNEVFGFKEAIPSRDRKKAQFFQRYGLMEAFDDKQEKSIPVAWHTEGVEKLGTIGYTTDSTHQPLAAFEDGTAMLTYKSYGKGKAYAWGIDIGYFFYLGYCSRAEDISRSYVNEYEPDIDIILRILKEIYCKGNENAVTLWPVPDDKKLAVMITHDVDFGKSQENAVLYAETEFERKIKATYFWQTKYVHDYYDDAFFNGNATQYTSKLAEMGMEIGSHGVSHAPSFLIFPMGSGTEQYPSYRPYISLRNVAHNGTVLGELRVSKYLLEAVGGADQVVSFRPGHLSNPWALPEALRASGYRYSSSMTANTALTHLPFQLTYNRETIGSEPVFEFPITIEDEGLPILGQRLEAAVDLATKISKYGGSFVVLIHPNIADYKLKFEQDLVDKIKPWSWFGTIGEYGDWWSARNQIKVNVAPGKEPLVKLTAPMPVSGLTLEIPEGWRLTKVDGAAAVQNGNHIVLAATAGEVQLQFVKGIR